MTSTQIKLQIGKYELKIRNNNKSIKKAEKDYESLSGFKRNISAYQSNFSSGNQGKSQALEAVSQIKGNCLTASRYYTGMKKLVVSLGGKIVSVLLDRLIDTSQGSMRGYLDKISNLEDENIRYQNKIEQLKRDLKIAEMNEALADANK